MLLVPFSEQLNRYNRPEAYAEMSKMMVVVESLGRRVLVALN
jgi:hypothetical protein